MKGHWFAAALLAVALNAWAQAPAPAPAGAWRGYDETADARAAIELARAQATGGRRVLVVFGANWCGDCRVLDTAMKQGRLKELVEAK